MMKKLIANIVGLFLLMTSLIACTEESTFDSDVHETGTITLGLNYKMLSRAAEEAGDDLYNENKIEKVDIFFYRGSDLNTCIFYPENVTLNSGEGTVTVKVPQEQLGLFESGAYSVYVIANGGFSRSELANKSVDQLKALSFTTDFLLNNGTPASFLMDGLSSNITLTKDGTSGQVDLYRAASKIVLTATVQDEIVGEDGTHYTPLMDGMYVSLYNGVKKTNVNTADKPYTVSTGDYFSTPDRAIKEKRNMGKDEKSGHVPFYSYATSWDENDKNETYLLLTVPWKVKSEAGEEYTRYYYRVPINNQYKNLVRNNLYRINLSVAILGSTQKEDAVDVNPNYLILNWSTEEINADLEDFKYLVLDENKASIYNTNAYDVGCSSSSEINVSVVSISYPKYNKDGIPSYPPAGDTSQLKWLYRNNMLHVEHPIPSNYVPWTISLEVTNKDIVNKKCLTDSLTIIQYPAIYLEGEKSNGIVYVNERKHGQSIDYGTIVNPNTVKNGTANNSNQTLYTITATYLGNDFNYSIGNPREPEPNNLGGVAGDRTDLTNYYPTREDNNTSNMIAPKFMVASSFGLTESMSYNTAKKRCATYEENGFPKGRWRIPTRAEISFTIDLQEKSGVIPELFNKSDGKYWTSDKRNYNGGTSSSYVRCVYDIWYWGMEKDKNASSYSD